MNPEPLRPGDPVTVHYQGGRALALVVGVDRARRQIIVEMIQEGCLVACTEDELTRTWRMS